MRRREFIGLGVGSVAAVSLGAAFWDELFGSAESRPLRRGSGYGPLGPPDENGVRLPEGFRSRIVARGGEVVPGTDYRWHLASDGMATFPDGGAAGGGAPDGAPTRGAAGGGAPDGAPTRGAAGRDGAARGRAPGRGAPHPHAGFVLVSNSETFEGGASALRFDRDGHVLDAYSILSGTAQNCSGGGTPWGTWLSCEEVEDGRVWECDPAGRKRAVPHAAMGIFKHEAAAVDARARHVYLTEDLVDGGLYRFTPRRWPDLSAGLLEIARVERGGAVEWVEVPDPSASRERTRRQVPGSTRFKRGEGIWLDGGTLYVSTTADHRVHAYDTRRERIRGIYDGLASASAPLLRVDQLTGSRAGEVFVCEDIATEEIDMGVIAPDRTVSRFLSVSGPQHRGSELTGVTFDPSGSRMYFSSQRAFPKSDEQPGPGAIYEITGPFRGAGGHSSGNSAGSV